MGTVLYIKANAKPDSMSRTFEISNYFVDAYQKIKPQDKIITLDLYQEGIEFLNIEKIKAVFGPKTAASKEHPILKYAYQFLEADKYIIAAPLWNLSIPAILKAYIDYICVTGITFKYTENGAIGLCKGKKAINITTRGGQYSTGPLADFEMCDRYLRKIFTFLGISDFTTIAADELDIIGNDVAALLAKAKNEAEAKVNKFAADPILV